MLLEHVGVGVEVDARRVRHVEALFLEPHDQWVLEPDEVTRPGAERVGPVERHDPRPGLEVAAPPAEPVVEGVVAVLVVRLPLRHRIDHQEPGAAGVVADRQRHVPVGAVVADDAEEVDAGREPVVEGELVGRRPVRAVDHVHERFDLRGWLHDPGQDVGLPDEARAEALVPAHAVPLEVVRGGGARDLEGDLLAPVDAGRGRESLDEPVGAAEHPRTGPRLGVLGLDPRRDERAGRGGGVGRQGGRGGDRPGLVVLALAPDDGGLGPPGRDGVGRGRAEDTQRSEEKLAAIHQRTTVAGRDCHTRARSCPL